MGIIFIHELATTLCAVMKNFKFITQNRTLWIVGIITRSKCSAIGLHRMVIHSSVTVTDWTAVTNRLFKIMPFPC